MSAVSNVKGAATGVATSKAVMGSAGNYGPVLIGIAGAITFVNEWLQQGDNHGDGINWATIPWTVVAMIGFSLLGDVEPFLGNALGASALLTELMVPFKGRKPPITYLLEILPKSK